MADDDRPPPSHSQPHQDLQDYSSIQSRTIPTSDSQTLVCEGNNASSERPNPVVVSAQQRSSDHKSGIYAIAEMGHSASFSRRIDELPTSAIDKSEPQPAIWTVIFMVKVIGWSEEKDVTQKQLSAVKLLLSHNRPRLDDHHMSESMFARLHDFLLSASTLVEEYLGKLVEAKPFLLAGGSLRDDLLILRSQSVVFEEFLSYFEDVACYNSPLTSQAFEEIVNGWKSELQLGIESIAKKRPYKVARIARGASNVNNWFDRRLLGFDTHAFQYKKNLAVQLLLSDDRPHFDMYTGKHSSWLVELLDLARNELGIRVHGIKVTQRQFATPSPPGEDYATRGNVSIYEQFILFIRAIWAESGNKLSAHQFDCIIKWWNDSVFDGLSALLRQINQIDLFPYHQDIQQYLSETIELADKCLDSDFMNTFVDLLTKYCSSIPAVGFIPSVFLCAPSGSGKSIFGTNLGTTLPSLHWLYRDVDNPQACYLPFRNITIIINDAIDHDIAVYKIHCNTKQLSEYSTTATFLNRTGNMIEFEFVHMIVSLFEALFGIKDAIEADFTWLDAQFRIETVEKGKMSLWAGKERLQNLVENRNIDLENVAKQNRQGFSRLPPLAAFIDECNLLDSDGDLHASNEDSRRLQFVRSILRILKVVPILTGTDARASNFCAREDNCSRDSGAVWVIVLNDFPGYNLKVFEKECSCILNSLENDHPCRPSIVRILNFLKAARLYDNPWLIFLAFDFIRRKVDNGSSSSSSILQELLNFLSCEFIARKKKAHYFSVGQLSYIMGQYWKNDMLLLDNFSEACINGHLAHLHGRPDIFGKPYFTLKVHQKVHCYFLDDSTLPKPYSASSYYTPFHRAPLTGLMLFGIDSSATMGECESSHIPFVSHVNRNEIGRVSSFDAILRCYNMFRNTDPDRIVKHSATGTPTEILFHASAVVSSRANGPKGCDFLTFLKGFIRELQTNKVCYSQSNRLLTNDTVQEILEHSDNVTNPPTEPYNTQIPLQDPMDKEKETDFYKDEFLNQELATTGASSEHELDELPKKKLKIDEFEDSAYAIFPNQLPKLDVLGPHEFEKVIVPLLAPTAVPEWPQAAVELLSKETDGPMRLGVFRPSHGNDKVDCELFETNLSEVLTPDVIPCPKEYGYPGNKIPLLKQTKRTAVIIGECKEWTESIALERLCNRIVIPKFKDIDYCRTFMVLTLRTSNFEEEYVAKSLKYLNLINVEGFHLWIVKKKPATDDVYELKSVPHQPTRANGSKDIIIITLEKIWNDPRIISRVLRVWGHNVHKEERIERS